jgi:hypothetical protein
MSLTINTTVRLWSLWCRLALQEATSSVGLAMGADR